VEGSAGSAGLGSRISWIWAGRRSKEKHLGSTLLPHEEPDA